MNGFGLLLPMVATLSRVLTGFSEGNTMILASPTDYGLSGFLLEAENQYEVLLWHAVASTDSLPTRSQLTTLFLMEDTYCPFCEGKRLFFIHCGPPGGNIYLVEILVLNLHRIADSVIAFPEFDIVPSLFLGFDSTPVTWCSPPPAFLKINGYGHFKFWKLLSVCGQGFSGTPILLRMSFHVVFELVLAEALAFEMAFNVSLLGLGKRRVSESDALVIVAQVARW
ncbi:hypothetical protein PanWU01x14_206340 [Parasponia andersonii]|uniref:RNase H type-1 domain-containing protein n=1 Tax=Parasponia andersonii TaxID=3476 RepID=A0A2P5BVI8_PARAD|nr:hypothetical protein PanWU01x14_206340 [Parasponia andersonii]